MGWLGGWRKRRRFRCSDLEEALFDLRGVKLIHVAKTPADAKSILANGFIIDRNPAIIAGIYTTFPDAGWTKPGRTLELTLKRSTWFDSGADRPIDALHGNGNKAWNALWWSVLEELGANDDDAEESITEAIFADRAIRREYAKLMTKTLLKCDIDVLVHGGENIIIRPSVVSAMQIV